MLEQCTTQTEEIDAQRDTMLVFFFFGKGWESTAERQKIEKNKERSAPWQLEIAKKQQRA